MRHYVSRLMETDDQAIVRKNACICLQKIAHKFPATKIKVKVLSSGHKDLGPIESIKIVDDAFSRIANAMSDCSVQNQITAVKCLESFSPEIGIEFVIQTLDKKLMSNLRKKQSYNEKERGEMDTGEFSSGNKWNDDAPKSFNEDTINIIDASACGAFTQGLENESADVRLGTIDALIRLTVIKKSKDLAKKSLDALIDMLNDEIETVRLHAVKGVTAIMKNSDADLRTLYADQFQNVISALDDSVFSIRMSIRQLLSECVIKEVDSVYKVVTQLIRNLSKYPQDKEGIWKTFSALGKNHAASTQSLTNCLLNIHPFYDCQEPNMEEPAYVGILLMIFSAAAKLPVITTMTPKFIPRHYQYLRHSMPDLVPEIRLYESLFSNSFKSVLTEDSNDNVSDYLKNLITDNFIEFSDISSIRQMVQEYILVMSDHKSALAKVLDHILDLLMTLNSINKNREIRQNERLRYVLQVLKSKFINSNQISEFSKELELRISLYERKFGDVQEILTHPAIKFEPKTDFSMVLSNYAKKKLRNLNFQLDKLLESFTENLLQHDSIYSSKVIKSVMLGICNDPVEEISAEIICPDVRCDFVPTVVEKVGVKIPVVAKLWNFEKNLRRKLIVRVKTPDDNFIDFSVNEQEFVLVAEEERMNAETAKESFRQYTRLDTFIDFTRKWLKIMNLFFDMSKSIRIFIHVRLF